MTTLEDRPNTALIVIDVQNGVVKAAHERDAVVANIADIGQCLMETGDRSTVHLLVRAVAAVHPYHGRLVVVGGRVRRRPPKRLRPVRGEALGVLRVKALAERVAHHLVRHHTGMPGTRQTEQAVVTARGFVHRRHAPQNVPDAWTVPLPGGAQRALIGPDRSTSSSPAAPTYVPLPQAGQGQARDPGPASGLPGPPARWPRSAGLIGHGVAVGGYLGQRQPGTATPARSGAIAGA